MKPNKSQETVQSKFSKREITPSPEAWDRLDTMLTVAEKNEKKMPWLKIAASLLLFGTIGYFILQNQKEKQQPNQIIDTVNELVEETNANKQEEVLTTDSTKILRNENLNQSNDKPQKTYKRLTPTEKAITPKIKEFEKLIIQDIKRPNQTRLAENIEDGTKLLNTENNKNNENKIEEKITQTNTSFKIKVATLDDYEGEKLNLKLDTKKEKELDPTFKKKAWEKFKTVSTAIVERNYEE